MKAKDKNVKQLSWYVINYDFNNRMVRTYDVFKHTSFVKDVIKIYEQSNAFEEFKKKLPDIIRYYFWCRCEYEILISGWPPTKTQDETIKIDWDYQLHLNFNQFAIYIWKILNGTFTI